MCWRLARQLANEHGARVTLLIDRPATLRAIEPRADAGRLVDGVRLDAWPGETGATQLFPGPDARRDDAEPPAGRVVISAFGCELPAHVRRGLSPESGAAPPLWVNLEYLSAEDWVDGCHGLASRKPADGAIEHFFYPGFTPTTGGLLRERKIVAERREFQGTGKEALWLADHGLAGHGLADRGFAGRPGELLASLFCYPESRAGELLQAMAAGTHAIRVLVPAGVALDAVGRTLGTPLSPGEKATLGNLTVERIPMLDQAGYDRLLWSCDLNFVRGEDSWIRAHWAGRPFVWQPYPQTGQTHQIKLAAFLDRLESIAGQAPGIRRMMSAWSGDAPLAPVWEDYLRQLGPIGAVHARWTDHLASQPDLAERLVEFCRNRL